MFKELSIVFCTMVLGLVQDIVTVPVRPKNEQPISQWSGQINGFDVDRNYQFPGYGTGNGNGMGSGSNGMGSGSNGMGGGNNAMGNGMGSGSGSNGMGNGSNGMGNGSNGMGNGSNFSSGWINTFSNGANNGMGSVSNSSSGWVSGFNNGSNNGNGNGSNPPGNVMSDEQWNNGFGGMSWSNGTNTGFGSIQNQTNGYPGSGYPSMYYQQYSQSFVMPTPANPENLQNATPPNPNGFTGPMYNNAGNMANINNPTGIQFQGCGPQSSSSTVSSETESIPATEANTPAIEANTPVTEANTPVTEVSSPGTEAGTDDTQKTQDGKGRTLTSRTTSNKKRNKH